MLIMAMHGFKVAGMIVSNDVDRSRSNLIESLVLVSCGDGAPTTCLHKGNDE
jgi:hypothetical protein